MILDWRGGGLQCPPCRDGIGDIAGPHFGERIGGIGGYFLALVQQGAIEIKNDQCHTLDIRLPQRRVTRWHILSAPSAPDRL